MPRKITIIFLFFVCVFSIFAQENFPKQTVNLLFVGDAMQHKSQLMNAKSSSGYDYSSYFELVKSDIDSADVAVVNLETTLPGKAYTGYPTFGSPDAFAHALKDAGFNVFLTANNHCLDKGQLGLERTIMMLDSLDVKHTGTYVSKEKHDLYNPLMIIKKGIRIAILNYTFGTNGIEVKSPNVVNYIDRKTILRDIESSKLMKADLIVACMHWGIEYKLKESREQRDLAKFLVDNGVRLVIGGHPHVVEPMVIQKDNDSIQSVVYYSLGNYVSGMKVANTTGGMVAHISVSKTNTNVVSIDSCGYSLVYVNKPIVNKKQRIQLIPIEKYDNEEGKTLLGDATYKQMMIFARAAKQAIENKDNR